MKLKIILPDNVFLDETVDKVISESPSGSFCIRPGHIDYVTALVPGILSYTTFEDREHFLALDGGLLVKNADQVLISSRNAVSGDLGTLRDHVARMITDISEKERKTRTSMARLEADFIRRFMEFGKVG